MSIRERWLVTGLIVVTMLLPMLALWQQVRYNRAQRAIQEFIALEAQAEAKDAERVVLIRQARPEIQRSLERGEFSVALQRLKALSEENRIAGDSKNRGQEVGVNELWPPKSPSRRKAQQALRLLVRKQRQGYDVTAAQEALIRVAEAARAGQKKQALAAFQEMENLVQYAALRPGFQAPRSRDATAAPVAPGQAAAGQRVVPGRMRSSAVSPAQVQQFLQFFQFVVPQLIEQAPPEQQGFLRRLQPLGNELEAAYRAGKDIRPVMPLVQKLGEALRRRDQPTAERLLGQVRAALHAARPLPQGSMPPIRPPAMPRVIPRRAPRAARPAAKGLPSARPPLIPPAAKGKPPQLAPEQILQVLDTIRQMPEPVYRQQRAQIAALVNTAIAEAGGMPPIPKRLPKESKRPPTQTGGTSLAVGEAATLHLEFGPSGEIIGLWGLGHNLSSGLSPGGLSLALGEGMGIPLKGELKSDGKTLSGRMTSPAGTTLVTYRQDGQDLLIHAETRRDREGEAGFLMLHIPLRAAGWRWEVDSEGQVIAVDEKYTVSSRDGAELKSVTLRGEDIQLKVMAPGAATIAYDPGPGALLVRFALPATKGTTQSEVRLSASRGSD
ncbi:MAG: hypothetical protein M3347_10690 [Armatimonadota bacterium]|nr:hypothetical protein [Armatimonadota bacterium]